MRELLLAGWIAVAFGLGSYYATGELGAFGWINLAGGAAAVVLAALRGARRMRGFASPAARAVLARPLRIVVAVLASALALERAAALSGLRLDWTVERRFELAPATREALASLPQPLRATLYHARHDARTRRTRFLLDSMARAGDVRVRERLIEESEDEAERFGITGLHAVVLELGERFETVERPLEGALLEAVLRLRGAERRTLYVALGEGEGDPDSTLPHGFSGLRAALENEGYRLRGLVTAAVPALPEDAAALLVIAPQRALRPEAAEMLRRYLGGAGRLVALLEPGVETGLEVLLHDLGFDLPDGVVVDPASGPAEGAPAGVNPILGSYATHPVTRGLTARTLTFFLRARPVIAARKPEPRDELRSLVFSSPRAWLATNATGVQRGFAPESPVPRRAERYPLVAAGRYPRATGEARVVVFGDADFATNQYLRALYNLDLLLNAIHWTLEREEAITLRPKLQTPDQDPLTPQQALTMLYGVGFLLPEALLIAGVVVWSRRRGA